MRLQSKVAIVSGGGSGIGRAIALRFGQEGAALYIPDKDLDGADETAHKIRRSGGEAVACQTDVTDATAVDLAVHGTIDAFGKVDILVNNAGISWSKQILELSNDEWDLMIRTHLHGCFYLSRAVAKKLVQRNENGKILNMSSVSGILGSVGRGPYGAAKGGMITLTRIMAVELAAYRINVNALAPGPILTPMMEPLWDDVKEYPRDVPLKRFGKPEEVADAALFLCSPESDYITGITLPVDGGMSIAGKMNRSMPRESPE